MGRFYDHAEAVGTVSDTNMCEAIYFAHTQSPLLQDMEARQQRILDADYLKADLETMVDELEISPGSKSKLKRTLQKFPTLFKRWRTWPIRYTTGDDCTPRNGRHYSTSKAFEAPFKKEINHMCDTKVLRKLSHDDDSPWSSPSFAQPKKTGDI